MTPGPKTAAAVKGTTAVLLTLSAGQFLMALDSSVMNVSIATVAKDLGTTVTGIQTAITLYTLYAAKRGSRPRIGVRRTARSNVIGRRSKCSSPAGGDRLTSGRASRWRSPPGVERCQRRAVTAA
jgi:hypothetical protein